MGEWNRFWASVSVLEFAGWAAAAGGILWAVVKSVTKGWPRVKKFVAWIDSLVALAGFMQRTDGELLKQSGILDTVATKLAEIHHETHNNDGSSLKDSTDRIELGVLGLYKVLGKVVKDNPELVLELAIELERTSDKKPASKPRSYKPKDDQ